METNHWATERERYEQRLRDLRATHEQHLQSLREQYRRKSERYDALLDRVYASTDEWNSICAKLLAAGLALGIIIGSMLC
ncbi:hypothetical protein [Tellurirhabdus rosea]|uniref:hypothetical protein n=1 Tax=Tellurirhabdus rosea TaxID=2674997 RepID=UPI002255B469|nr:hypothetical protein [Tellurirhabdus rosea]